MAGIAGIYCANGSPADLAELKRMTAAVEHRGPDGITYWNDGPIALAHLQFHTTPESLNERQPLLSSGGEACLVWNGRIDNREELLAELTAAGAVPADQTDPGLTLAAYLAWGTECLQRLVGDFAFAIWDLRHRRLWCARDYIGVRPFYYFWDGKTFLFGPEIRALLAHPLVSLKINEGMAGEYLANAITSREETLYADIRRLPSGSHLTLDGPGRLRIESWWNPELSLIEYRTDEEYADHFRTLFDQSVQSRMRCNAGWGIQLSGGLDSSSIAVSARAVLDASGASDARIRTFSMTCPGKPWDESEDIAAVVEKAGLTADFFRPLEVDLGFFQQRADFWRDYPGSPNGEPMFLPIFDAARKCGARVLLNGMGGDEWLDGRPEHLADLAAGLARPGALREFVERAKSDWREYSGEGHWQTFLVRKLLVIAAPNWALARRKRFRLERHGIFSPEFLGRTRLAERIATPIGGQRRFSSRAQRAVFRLVTSGIQLHILEANERTAALSGVELRFPFFDRRLAEFCLRLPEKQRQHGSVWKRVLRNAMVGRLPEQVRLRAFKAEFSELFTKLFYADPAQKRLQSLAIKQHTDWFDPRRLDGRLTAALRSRGATPPGAWNLWNMIAVDLWLGHIFASGGTVPTGHGVPSRGPELSARKTN